MSRRDIGSRNVDSSKKLPTVLSLCTGYGGIERGLELAGFEHRTVAYVEIEAFAIANLVAKMETGQMVPAPVWTDLKTLPAQCFRDRVDLLTGGYPCQPFSAAGKRKGAEDPRHLWPHIKRHVETIRPVRCLFENVEGHINLGLREVIGDLEELGYTVAWGIFSAVEVGAPHQRKRVYILADSTNGRLPNWELPWIKKNEEEGGTKVESELERLRRAVAHADSLRLQGVRPDSDTQGREGQVERSFRLRGRATTQHHWEAEPSVGRVVDGLEHRVDRLRLLGNGVVPQTAAKAWAVLSEQIQQIDDYTTYE